MNCGYGTKARMFLWKSIAQEHNKPEPLHQCGDRATHDVVFTPNWKDEVIVLVAGLCEHHAVQAKHMSKTQCVKLKPRRANMSKTPLTDQELENLMAWTKPARMTTGYPTPVGFEQRSVNTEIIAALVAEVQQARKLAPTPKPPPIGQWVCRTEHIKIERPGPIALSCLHNEIRIRLELDTNCNTDTLRLVAASLKRELSDALDRIIDRGGVDA